MAYDREAIKEHYNQHVTEGVSTHEALRQRREGPAAPLKKFHNDIKRRLIYRFGYRAEALLDYACGRGGDIHKWWTAEIKYVKGLDLSPKEIEEAQRRYGELRAKEEGVFEADFQQIDNLGLELVIEDQQYDLATCMFALHYFFDAEKHIMTMLDTVARNLKPGGYFIATVPDGKRIKAHLLKSGGLVEKPQLVLKQKWEGKDTPFGSAFVMEIPDTVVEGHEGVSEGSHEYLVFEKVLLGVAAKSGLYPVTDYDDPSLTQLFEESEGAVKHFNPSYPQTTDPSLTLASKLYMAVVFQKVGSAAEAKAPPKRPPPLQSGPRRQQQQQPRGPRRSPPREERFAAAEQANGAAAAAASGGQSAPAWRPQQQQQQQQDRGQGKGFNRNENWQLPYHAVVLPPTQWPCAYYNVKDPNFLEHRATKYNRFKIVPPPMPMSAGPVPWDPEINNFRRQLLPDGRVIDSYYDELQYHEELQQAAAGPAIQQQQQHGGPTPPAAAGRGPAGAPQQQNRQQQQQYPGPPAQQQQPQASQPAGSPNANAKAAAAAAENVEATEAGGKGSRGRGRARMRGKGRAAAAAAEGEDAAAAGDAPTPARRARGGRGSRGARGGAAAGAKRARDNQADADSTATGAAADGAEGEAAPDAAAAAADDGPAAKRPASAAKPAGGGAAPKFLKGPVPDPLGYKEKVVVELPQEVVEQLAELAPQYAEPLI